MSGTVQVPGPAVVCPQCGEALPTVITCELAALGPHRQEMKTDADLSDVWAHMWGHTA